MPCSFKLRTQIESVLSSLKKEVSENEAQKELVPDESLVVLFNGNYTIPESANYMNHCYKDGEVKFFLVEKADVQDLLKDPTLLDSQERDFTSLCLPYATPPDVQL